MTNPFILEISNASKCFGGIVALNNAHLKVKKGQIYGLIGPNGAGKSTFFNIITGLYSADSGDFLLEGKPYKAHKSNLVAKSGISRTFQNIRLFSSMSVLENVMTGCHVRSKKGALAAILKLPSQRREEAQIRQKSLDLLEFVGIKDLAYRTSKTLSYGDQRRLEIARALAIEPKVLALDEPAAGMNSGEKVALQSLLKKITSKGVTILLIEHDVKLVMGLCEHITVLDYGEVIAEGSPEEVQQNPDVINAYLGTGTHS